MEVAYFVQQDFLNAGSLWEGEQVSIFHTYDELVDSSLQPEVIVIGFKDSVLVQQLLFKLRSDRTYYLSPLFLETKVRGTAGILADGIASNPNAARRKARKLNVSPLAEFCASDQDKRLLSFLATRPSKVLEAVIQSHQGRTTVHYPLLTALADVGTDEQSWLNSLLKQGNLQTGQQIRELHACGHCCSENLNFIEACPHCEAADCGQTSSVWLDPNAERTCQTCRQVYIEPQLKTYCLSCHKVGLAKESVLVTPVFNYQITAEGVAEVASLLQAKELAKTLITGAALHQKTQVRHYK